MTTIEAWGVKPTIWPLRTPARAYVDEPVSDLSGQAWPLIDAVSARPNVAPQRLQLLDDIRDLLLSTTSDFRTIESMARQLGRSTTEVRVALGLLGGEVRRPLGRDPRHATWYRLASRGLTRSERWLRFRAIASRTSI